MLDPTTLIGTLGALLILIAFTMNQMHKWKNDYLIYDLINLIGSGLLIIYAAILKSYPFLVLNGVWAFLSLRDVVIDFKKNSESRRKNFFQKWLK